MISRSNCSSRAWTTVTMQLGQMLWLNRVFVC